MKNRLLAAERQPGYDSFITGVVLAMSITAMGVLAGSVAHASGIAGPAPHRDVVTALNERDGFPHVPITTRQMESLWTVRSRYDTIIHDTARRHDVDPALVKAIVQAESAFDAGAISRSGARGLMQVLPETASRFAVTNLSDPRQNLRAGVLYLKHLLDLFEGDVAMAVAAYNAGPNTVRRYRGVPPYRETRSYLVKVMELREAYADQLNRS